MLVFDQTYIRPCSLSMVTKKYIPTTNKLFLRIALSVLFFYLHIQFKSIVLVVRVFSNFTDVQLLYLLYVFFSGCSSFSSSIIPSIMILANGVSNQVSQYFLSSILNYHHQTHFFFHHITKLFRLFSSLFNEYAPSSSSTTPHLKCLQSFLS